MRLVFKALPERADIAVPEGITHEVKTYLDANPMASQAELLAHQNSIMGTKQKPDRAATHHPPLAMEDWHRLVQAGMPFKNWYPDFIDAATQHLGEHNLMEVSGVLGPTSQQAPPVDNVRSTLRAMRAAREVNKLPGFQFAGEPEPPFLHDAYGKLQEGPGGERIPNPDVNPHYAEFWHRLSPKGEMAEMNPASGITESQVSRIWDLYRLGHTNVPSNSKTASYQGNFLSGYHRDWDPFVTMDTWALKPAGVPLISAKKKEATDRWYGKGEPTPKETQWARGVYAHLAGVYGLAPHQIQAAIWMATKAIGDMVGPSRAVDPTLPVETLLGEAVARGVLDPRDAQSGTHQEAFSDPYNAAYLNRYGSLLREPSPGLAGKATLYHYPVKSNAEVRGGKMPQEHEIQTGGEASPVNPERRAMFRERTLDAAPEMLLPTSVPVAPEQAQAAHLQTLSRLGYNRETKKLGALAELPFDHQVHGETIWTPQGQKVQPVVTLRLPGMNREHARYVAAILGEAGDLEHVSLRKPDPQGPKIGLDLAHPGGGAWSPEEVDKVAQSMQQYGIDTELHQSGNAIRFVHYEGEQNPQWVDQIEAGLAGLGLTLKDTKAYNGYSERVPRTEFAGIRAEQGVQYRRPGRPDLPGGLATAYRQSLAAGPDARDRGGLDARFNDLTRWDYAHPASGPELVSYLNDPNPPPPPAPPKKARAKKGKVQKAVFIVQKAFKLQGELDFQGLPVKIENRAGSIRRGKGWETKVLNDYGYFADSMGVDGDPIDVYVGPNADSEVVFVVHQHQIGKVAAWGKKTCPECGKPPASCWHDLDEDKVMLGFLTQEAAIHAYNRHYDDWRFLGPVSKLSISKFRRLLAGSKRKPRILKCVAPATFQKGIGPLGLQEAARVQRLWAGETLNLLTPQAHLELHLREARLWPGFSKALAEPPRKLWTPSGFQWTPEQRQAIEDALLGHFPAVRAEHVGDTNPYVGFLTPSGALTGPIREHLTKIGGKLGGEHAQIIRTLMLQNGVQPKNPTRNGQEMGFARAMINPAGGSQDPYVGFQFAGAPTLPQISAVKRAARMHGDKKFVYDITDPSTGMPASQGRSLVEFGQDPIVQRALTEHYQRQRGENA